MNELREKDNPARMEDRLHRGEGEEVVTLEQGDPIDAAPLDAAEWDWDAEAISIEQHCSGCGAWGPVFRLDDGSKVCGVCAHGQAVAP
jgi:hypothetical protein